MFSLLLFRALDDRPSKSRQELGFARLQRSLVILTVTLSAVTEVSIVEIVKRTISVLRVAPILSRV